MVVTTKQDNSSRYIIKELFTYTHLEAHAKVSVRREGSYKPSATVQVVTCAQHHLMDITPQ
jgi:hypothetical protein